MKATLEKMKGPGLAKVKQGIGLLRKTRALVGIPQQKSSRKGGKLNNAELLYIFSNGSPARGQPPRRVIEPAIAADGTRQQISRKLGDASKSALEGDHAGMLKNFDLAGQVGENASKRWFTDSRNGWPPNALSTINRKLGRLKPKAREDAIDAIVAAKGDTTGIVTPGIDTGQMRRALTHVTDEEAV